MQTPPTHTHIPTDKHASCLVTKSDTSVTDPSGEAGEANRCAGNYLDPPHLGRDMGTSCQEAEFSPSVSPAVDVPCPTIHMLSESSGAVSLGLTAAAGDDPCHQPGCRASSSAEWVASVSDVVQPAWPQKGVFSEGTE